MGDVCATCGKEYANLNDHYYQKITHKPDHWPECYSCGKRYKDLGNHWALSGCKYPNLTQQQYEIVVGLMMGDGSVTTNSETNSLFQCRMITKEYLEWLDTIFNPLGTGVRLVRTAEESAKQNRDNGFSPNANQEDYSDIYSWRIRSLPQLNEFKEWYGSGEKVWPEDINLTSTVLKHWYVGDGYYDNKDTNDRIKISLMNEIENEEKIAKYFEDVGLPRPNNWSVTEQINGFNCSAIWHKDESQQLWEYMLEDSHGIPPGFEYKWPEEFR